MDIIYVNIIRGVVSNFFVLLHMFLAGEKKYSRKVTIVAFGLTYLILTSITIMMYYFLDMTIFSKVSAFVWIICGIVSKPFFKDSIMKWMFNVITVINVFIFVVIVSFAFSSTHWGLLAIRVAIYGVIIFGFYKYLRTLYRQVADRWRLFLAASVAILLNFMYAIMTASDIQGMLSERFISLMLMILVMVLLYTTIFDSFNSILKEYEYRIEKNQAKLNEDLLTKELNAYEEFIEASKRHRHDLRHHNQILLGYLNEKDIQGAEEYLKLFNASIAESSIEQYSQNYIANSVLCLYARKAQLEEITFAAHADIPKELVISSPEFGSMLLNILENALDACKRANSKNTFITFTAITEDESLKIDLRNTLSEQVRFENDLPISSKANGGIGTKSVLKIVSKHKGMVNYKQENGTFVTQIILPI